MPFPAAIQAVIANGAATSGAVDLRGKRLLGIHMPTDLTGNTLTWSCSPTENGDYHVAYHLSTLAATATVITSAAADITIQLPDDKQPANCWLKLISSGNEGAARTFHLFTEDL